MFLFSLVLLFVMTFTKKKNIQHTTYKKVKCNSTKNYSHLSVISAILHSSLFNRSHSVKLNSITLFLCCWLNCLNIINAFNDGNSQLYIYFTISNFLCLIALIHYITIFLLLLIHFYRDFRPTSLEKGQEIYRLRIYEVYAWGVPILITTIAAVLDNLPENSSETFLRPRFGENKCWFYGKFVCLYCLYVRMSQYWFAFLRQYNKIT